MERQNAEQWDGVKLEVLAQAYMEVRREMWSLLAARVGEKWQLVETKCMEKGLKNLTQACRSAQKKLENEQEDHHVDMSHMSSLPESHYSAYPSYPQQQQQQQRVPSIQSMLHPMQQHPHHMQQSVQQTMHQPMHQPMQQSIQQPLQQPLQQPMQQPMQQSMPQQMHQQSMAYSSHQLSHPQ
ncbi:hypothetical protein ACJBU6_10083 [Exserohilum turcicum]